jgi:hypothetical protein
MASFGELIFLVNRGIKIPAKLMESLGVHDKSMF